MSNLGSQITHCAFSDESHWNKGRYRSIALVSMPRQNVDSFEHEISALLEQSKVSEFRWCELQSAKERFAAIRLIDFAITNACKSNLRIDVLEWDIQDSRHKVSKRDDIANLERMYYHIFENVLRLRWGPKSIWCLLPDEQSALDWAIVKDCLVAKGAGVLVVEPDVLTGSFKLRLLRDFQIVSIIPSHSKCKPLIQLADLFGGLAIFSRERYSAFFQWEYQHTNQPSLFPFKQQNKLSGADIEKCQVLNQFNARCKKNRLGVSLKKYNGLRTLHPKYPINFWWYIPQKILDKAPTR